MIARTVPDSVRPPKVALVSDDPRDFEAAFRLVSRSAFLLARQLGRSTEESMESCITLHVTSIEAMWLRGTSAVSGDWSLHATLVAEPAHTLRLPSPVHTPRAPYTFTSIRSSATELTIRWKIQGPILDELTTARANHSQEMQLEHDYFWPQVFDGLGHQVQLSDFGTTFTKPATTEITVFIRGPGRYRIQLGDALTADDLQRWIVVP